MLRKADLSRRPDLICTGEGDLEPCPPKNGHLHRNEVAEAAGPNCADDPIICTEIKLHQKSQQMLLCR